MSPPPSGTRVFLASSDGAAAAPAAADTRGLLGMEEAVLMAREGLALARSGADASSAETRRDMVDSMRSRRSWTSSNRAALHKPGVSFWRRFEAAGAGGGRAGGRGRYFREASLSRFCRSEYVQLVFQTVQLLHLGFSRPHRTCFLIVSRLVVEGRARGGRRRRAGVGKKTFFSRHRSHAGIRALCLSFYLFAFLR